MVPTCFVILRIVGITQCFPITQGFDNSLLLLLCGLASASVALVLRWRLGAPQMFPFAF